MIVSIAESPLQAITNNTIYLYLNKDKMSFSSVLPIEHYTALTTQYLYSER